VLTDCGSAPRKTLPIAAIAPISLSEESGDRIVLAFFQLDVGKYCRVHLTQGSCSSHECVAVLLNCCDSAMICTDSIQQVAPLPDLSLPLL
jgi:hypothetical protein